MKSGSQFSSKKNLVLSFETMDYYIYNGSELHLLVLG
jgi:hypothetical protein